MAPIKVNIERVKILEQIAANSLLQILPSMSDQEISKMYTQGVQSLDTIVTGLLGGGKQSNELLAFLKPFIDNIPTLDNIRGGKKRKRKKTRKKGGDRTKRSSSSSSGKQKTTSSSSSGEQKKTSSSSSEEPVLAITAVPGQYEQQRQAGQMLGSVMGGSGVSTTPMGQLQEVSRAFINLNHEVTGALKKQIIINQKQHDESIKNFNNDIAKITKAIKEITEAKEKKSEKALDQRKKINKNLQDAEKVYAEFLKNQFKKSVVTQLAMVEKLEQQMINDPNSAELTGALYSGALTGFGVGAIGRMGHYAYQFMGGMMVKVISACDTMCESTIGAILQTLKDTAKPGASWWNPFYYIYETLHYSGLFKVMELVGDDRPFERFLGMFDECSPSRFNGTDAEVAEQVGSCRSDTSASSNLTAFLTTTLFLIVFLSVIGHYLRLRFQGGRSRHADSYMPIAAIVVPATAPNIMLNLWTDSDRVREIKKRLKTLRGLVTEETILAAAAQNALMKVLQSTNQKDWDTALKEAEPVTRASQKQEYEDEGGYEFDITQRAKQEQLRRLDQLDQELAYATSLFNAQLKAYRKQREKIQNLILKKIDMNADNETLVMGKMNQLLIENVENAHGFQTEAAKSVNAAIAGTRLLVNAEVQSQIKQIQQQGNLMLDNEGEKKEGGGKRKTKKRKHAKRKMTRKKRKMTRTKKKQIKRKR